jgi:hypothetical protein
MNLPRITLPAILGNSYVFCHSRVHLLAVALGLHVGSLNGFPSRVTAPYTARIDYRQF